MRFLKEYSCIFIFISYICSYISLGWNVSLILWYIVMHHICSYVVTTLGRNNSFFICYTKLFCFFDIWNVWKCCFILHALFGYVFILVVTCNIFSVPPSILPKMVKFWSTFPKIESMKKSLLCSSIWQVVYLFVFIYIYLFLFRDYFFILFHHKNVSYQFIFKRSHFPLEK